MLMHNNSGFNSNIQQKCGENTALFQSLSEIYLPLHRIIPFSNVEGQGNRTSIFLQGCKLNCLYCHNPETIPRYSEQAKPVTLAYLYQQVQSAQPFIRGVTVSGGEPTIHHRKLVPLFNALHQLGLTCYLDSSGFFDFDICRELIAVTDKFLFDLKGVGLGLQSLCLDRKNTAGTVPLQINLLEEKIRDKNLQRNFTNLQRLLPLNKIEEVRLVVINDFFDSYALLEQLAILLKPYPEVLLKLIRVHSKGARDPLGIERLTPSIEQMDKLTQFAKQQGIEKVIQIN